MPALFAVSALSALALQAHTLAVGDQFTFSDGGLSGITCTTVFADTPGTQGVYPYSNIIQLGVNSGYIGSGAACSGGAIGGGFTSINACPADSVTCADETFTTDVLLLCPNTECGAVDEYLMVYCEPVGVHCAGLYLTFWVDTDGNLGAAGPTPAPNLDLSGNPAGGGAAGVGDPVLTDFKGHVFMAGDAPHTESALFELAPRSWADYRVGFSEKLAMVTSAIKGSENGYFSESLVYTQAGCGSASFKSLDHQVQIEGPECIVSRVAHGDEGAVVFLFGDGETSLLISPHTYSKTERKGEGFLNFSIVGAGSSFLDACKSGLLCDDQH